MPKLEQTQTQEKEEPYRTPRAGKELNTSFLGMNIHVPARERDKIMAISLGADMHFPKVGDNSIVPYAAFYYSDSWQEKKRRLRLVAALFANFINFYDCTWNDWGLELAASWENYTLPIPSTLEIEDTELKDSEIYWGYLRGGLGIGWRIPIAPREIDSFISFYAFYEPGLLYFDETRNTGKNYIVPSSTYEDRIHGKVRIDAMERNIMEMRHAGWAAGFDFIRGHRYRWKDHDFNASFRKKDTEIYHIYSFYFTWAGGPKWLSEKHRFIFSVHGGISPRSELDRYSAPRIGGGPGGDEAEALSYSPIPGARLDEFIVNRYLLFTLEYRFEIFFFMYLHIKGVIGAVRRMEYDEDIKQVSLTKNEAVGSISVGLTTGFIWDSQLHVEYVHDRGILRGKEGQDGHSILVSCSKSF